MKNIIVACLIVTATAVSAAPKRDLITESTEPAPPISWGPNGELAIGANSLAYWGPLESGEALVCVRDGTLGEPTDMLLFLDSFDSMWESTFVASGGPTRATVSVGSSGSGAYQAAMETSSPGQYVKLVMFFNGAPILTVEPTAQDGVTPFRYGTKLHHTTGNLFEITEGVVNSPGTVAFSVAHDGAIATAGGPQWKFGTASGGQLIVEVDGQKYAITATPIP
jgi:hypothetical protein